MQEIKSGGILRNNSNGLVIPGFRSYDREEKDYFYGRQNEAAQLCEKIRNSRFFTIIGDCAVGKTSLINCRLLPALESKVDEVNTHVIQFQGSNTPYRQMAGVLSDFIHNNNRADGGWSVDGIEASLRESVVGLENVLSRILVPGERLFFVIDQFENIFIHDYLRPFSEQQNERLKFINLLTETIDQPDLDIHFLLAIRSENLGEFFEFGRLAELINQNSFLLNKPTFEQICEIIVGIFHQADLDIDEFNLKQIAAHFDASTYTLPALQYIFRRNFYNRQQLKKNKESIYRKLILDFDLGDSVSIDLNSIYYSHNQEHRWVCERIFKSLFLTDTRGRMFRKAVPVSHLAEMVEVPAEMVIDVINSYSTILPQVFHYDSGTALNGETVVMLSHEIIFRLWDKYSGWISDETASIEAYKKLSASSELYQMGKEKLLEGADLSMATKWREENKPTYAWGIQFNPAFNRTMTYLDLSQKRIELDKIDKQMRKARRATFMRYITVGLGIFSVLLVSFVVFVFLQKDRGSKAADIQKEKTPQENAKQNVVTQGYTGIQLEHGRVVESAEVSAEDTMLVEAAGDGLQPGTETIPDSRQMVIPPEENLAVVDRTNKVKEKTETTIAPVALTRERLISLSRNLAVESLQMTDSIMKGLLAYQAYIFSKRYEGQDFNAYLFMSLYNSLVFNGITPYETYQGHTKTINSLAFRPGTQHFYSAGSDGRVLEWSLTAPGNGGNVVLDDAGIYEVLEISDDGVWVAASTFDGSIHLLNLKSGARQPVVLSAHTSRIKSLVFTPDNNYLVSSGTDKKVFLWNILTGVSSEMNNPFGIVLDMRASPDGKYLVGGTRDGRILVWDRNDLLHPATMFEDPKNSFYSLEFNRSGSLLVLGDIYGTVHIWDFKARKLVLKVRSHSARILDMKFSPDGRMMASAGMDGAIYLWNVRNWNESRIVFDDNHGFVFSIFFTPDNRKLLSCDSEGMKIIARTLDIDQMSSRFCGLLKRNFTGAEWDRYIGKDVKYEVTCPGLPSEEH